MVDFPDAPSPGDAWTEEGTTWVYHSPPDAWVVATSNAGDAVTIVEADTDAGWQVWGDLLIQYGAQVIAQYPDTVNFPIAFDTVPSVNVSAVTVPGATIANLTSVAADSFGVLVYSRDGAPITDAVVQWISVGPAPDDLKQPKEIPFGGSAGGGGGGASVTTGDTFPADPAEGDLHYMTADTPGLFLWYVDPTSSQWVQTNGGLAEGEPVTIVEDDPSAGWFVSGSTLFQYGSIAPAGGDATITMPKPFADTTFQVVGNLRGGSGAMYASQFNPVTTTTFQMRCFVHGASADYVPILSAALNAWIAIGPAPPELIQPKTLTGVGGGATEAFHDPANAASWKIDHASNTLECWGISPTSDVNGWLQVTYPRTFAHQPVATAVPMLTPGDASWQYTVTVRASGLTTLGADMRFQAGSSIVPAENVAMYYHAIGAWSGS